jgi:hypothetical protein
LVFISSVNIFFVFDDFQLRPIIGYAHFIFTRK